MNTTKTLAVLSPAPGKTIPASAFHFDHHNGRAPQYAAKIAFTGHPPRDTALIDAEELREARDAVIALKAAAVNITALKHKIAYELSDYPETKAQWLEALSHLDAGIAGVEGGA